MDPDQIPAAGGRWIRDPETGELSPAWNADTCAPTATTRPTISCPGTHGYSVPAHSERTWCRSEWHTPQ